MTHEPVDKFLFDIVAETVSSALNYARKVEREGGYIKTQNNFPELSYFENGMPSFGLAWGNEPKDYTSVFDQAIFSISLMKAEYELEKQPGFLRLKTYFQSNAGIWSRCLASRATEPADVLPQLEMEEAFVR